MAEVQTAYPRGLDFEQVWAGLQETRKLIEEVARKMEVTDKRVGELTGRFGEVVEYMIVPNLVAKFRELGFEFTRAGPDVKIADREHDIHAEVDAFLENGDKVMIVEIKSKPNTDDVDYHAEKMEKLRRYADMKGDNRKYLGAIAGVVVGESVCVYALKNGLYVIEPSGDTFNIIEPKGKYHPREW
jgi:Holliday junction resolvase